jgi:hypothetical protein
MGNPLVKRCNYLCVCVWISEREGTKREGERQREGGGGKGGRENNHYCMIILIFRDSKVNQWKME